MWLIVRQLPIKAGWLDAPLTLWNLAETICLNKARNTKDMFSVGPKQDFLPHSSTTHPPTIKALQTAKINKIRPSASPHWFLTEGSHYQTRKANSYSPLPGNDLRPLDWNSDLLITTPLICVLRNYSKTLYT